jgi:hypothetical protein
MNSKEKKRRPREASSIETVMSEEHHNLIESTREGKEKTWQRQSDYR